MRATEKEKTHEAVKKLAKKMPVFVPVKRTDGECVFEQYEDGTEICLNYETTILPVKKFFLPAREGIFVFNKKRGKVNENKKPKKFIIFGLNSRDAEALCQLDEIMSKPVPDYFYFQRRNAATIISPDSRTDESSDQQIMPELKKLLIDAELLHDAVKWSWKNYSEIWEDLSKRCLSCGICTYVCPLCYCFSVDDSSSLDEQSCSRCRYWTACTLPEFAKVSGGHNFHKTLKERYYNWFYHKFVRGYNEYGKSLCVACGRCQKYCPAKIDIEIELVKIVEKYKTEQK